MVVIDVLKQTRVWHAENKKWRKVPVWDLFSKEEQSVMENPRNTERGKLPIMKEEDELLEKILYRIFFAVTREESAEAAIEWPLKELIRVREKAHRYYTSSSRLP